MVNTLHTSLNRTPAALRLALAGALLALGAGTWAADAAKADAKKADAKKADAAPAVELPRLSVQQIIERNLTARGGASAWKAVQSITYTGSMDAGKARPDNGINPSSREKPLSKPGAQTKVGQRQQPDAAQGDEGKPVTLPYKLTLERPRKQRMEIQFKDETLVQVYDGKNGWKLQPYLKRGALPFTDEEKKQAEDFPDIDGPLVDYAAKGTKVELEANDKVDGHPAYKLKLSFRNGTVKHLWIDGQTFLDLQTDGSRRLNGHATPVFTTLGDYRTVGGLKLPFLMQTRTEGLPDVEKIVVDKVELNPKLDASLFAKP